MAHPRATYRLQLHAGFDFAAATEIVPYLAELGVSHAYCSPYMQANPGSTHGYDVADPTRINGELGGREGLSAFSAALKARGLGQILDIVPNHMAVGHRENRWFWDVLEDGPQSPFARYFDVDWWSGDDRGAPSILVPILGDHFGRVLERDELSLRRDGADFTLHYFDHVLPVRPASLLAALEQVAQSTGLSGLTTLLAEWAALDSRAVASDHHTLSELHEHKQALRGRLASQLHSSAAAAEALDGVLRCLNADVDALEAVVLRQRYRLARWRIANDELDYRRFFNIQSLIGLRVEDPRVFDHVHQLPLELVHDGTLDGLRVDHVDGLRDPQRYLQRLRERAGEDAYLVVEKILAPKERLPDRWPVEGTTGYEFILDVSNLLVDGDNAEAMDACYAEFAAAPAPYEGLEYVAKHYVMNHLLHSEVVGLVSQLQTLADRYRRQRDHTRRELRDALVEFIAAFHVYRTYVQPGQAVDAVDFAQLNDARLRLRERRPDVDGELIDWLLDLASLKLDGELEREFALRFAQVSAPVMAKGAEDTAFYRYHRLLSLNEVGGAPQRFGQSAAHFHERMREAAQQRPAAMLALSTHDTKRSADVRARLHLLSEMPDAWATLCADLRTLGQHHRAPDLLDANTEYMLYQTLVGAFPISPARISDFMRKATREAKVHTSWMEQNAPYEEAVIGYAQALVSDPDCVARVREFLDTQRVIELGRLNALSQVTLLLTCPGVPDIYQGSELWDLSLVDPDNRRPVDYAQRRALLGALDKPLPALADDEAGEHKLKLTQTLLQHRATRPDCYLGAPYEALSAAGPRAEHAVAFIRKDLVVVVPRLIARLGGSWDGTVLQLPAGTFRNLLSPESVYSGRVELQSLLSAFPVAVLARETAHA